MDKFILEIRKNIGEIASEITGYPIDKEKDVARRKAIEALTKNLENAYLIELKELEINNTIKELETKNKKLLAEIESRKTFEDLVEKSQTLCQEQSNNQKIIQLLEDINKLQKQLIKTNFKSENSDNKLEENILQFTELSTNDFNLNE